MRNFSASSSAGTTRRPKYCSLDKMTGPCRAYMPSYYYDQSQGKCLRFIYGGCGGNGNRFQTVEDCEKQCDQGKILQNYFYFVTSIYSPIRVTSSIFPSNIIYRP